MKKLFVLLLILASASVHAEGPMCQSQALNGHTSELCVTSALFQHDYYTLKVDRALIFTLPDDYIENIELTHSVPQDAAIEFPLSIQGVPTVKIVGGCTPVIGASELGGKTIKTEVGRQCSFKWGSVDIVKELQLHLQ